MECNMKQPVNGSTGSPQRAFSKTQRLKGAQWNPCELSVFLGAWGGGCAFGDDMIEETKFALQSCDGTRVYAHSLGKSTR